TTVWLNGQTKIKSPTIDYTFDYDYVCSLTVVCVIQRPQFGSRSHFAYCPSYKASQMTRCEYESSMMTHIVAVILCFTTFTNLMQDFKYLFIVEK
ncbi:hypothetical protein DOY81_008947, partial [Sarcophaga bullata]